MKKLSWLALAALLVWGVAYGNIDTDACPGIVDDYWSCLGCFDPNQHLGVNAGDPHDAPLTDLVIAARWEARVRACAEAYPPIYWPSPEPPCCFDETDIAHYSPNF